LEKENIISKNKNIYLDLNIKLMQHIQKGAKVTWQKP
jgi:hypothetical protein